MPIFENKAQRVYFAHIPKNAGSATYLLFLRNGWSIANVQTSRKNKGRIGYRLYEEFGIEEIPQIGDKMGYRWSLQHAPYSVWKAWGAYDSSFAVIRNPFSRFVSCVSYHAKANRWGPVTHATFDRFIEIIQDAKGKSFDELPPIFRCQVDFLAPDTKLFRYESDWVTQIQAAYGLTSDSLEKVNVSKAWNVELSGDQEDFVKSQYAPDLELWQTL